MYWIGLMTLSPSMAVSCRRWNIIWPPHKLPMLLLFFWIRHSRLSLLCDTFRPMIGIPTVESTHALGCSVGKNTQETRASFNSRSSAICFHLSWWMGLNLTLMNHGASKCECLSQTHCYTQLQLTGNFQPLLARVCLARGNFIIWRVGLDRLDCTWPCFVFWSPGRWTTSWRQPRPTSTHIKRFSAITCSMILPQLKSMRAEVATVVDNMYRFPAKHTFSAKCPYIIYMVRWDYS